MKKILFCLLPLTLSTNVFAGAISNSSCQDAANSGAVCINVTFFQYSNTEINSVTISTAFEGGSSPSGCKYTLNQAQMVGYYAPDDGNCNTGKKYQGAIENITLGLNGGSPMSLARVGSFKAGSMTTLSLFPSHKDKDTLCYSWGAVVPPSQKELLSVNTSCPLGWKTLTGS